MKRILAGASLIVLTSCAVFAQTNSPAFEVATIKQAAPQQEGRMMVRMGGDAGRVDYANVSLKQVLARAYGVKQYQVSGPSWIDSERYDITAKVPDGVAPDVGRCGAHLKPSSHQPQGCPVARRRTPVASADELPRQATI